LLFSTETESKLQYSLQSHHFKRIFVWQITAVLLFAMSNPKHTIRHTLTFDDVLVVPAYSQVLPREVQTATQLSRNIRLNVPMVSSAMDTVTEWKMAVAMARSGGIGMIHKNMSIEAQAKQVKKVKRSESGMIIDPITLQGTALLEDALRIMKENRIGGIPIVDDRHKLVGIITNRDLRFEKNLKRRIEDVMTKERLVTASEGTNLSDAESILQAHKIEKLPVVDKQNVLKGLITFKDIQKVKNYPKACKDQYGRLLVGAAIGVTEDSLERISALSKEGVDVVTLDTAHGHSQGVIEMAKQIKKEFEHIDLVVGNVATEKAAKDLVNTGCDGIKVGVGPGSICTTRIIAGIGVPQLTAILDCAKVLANEEVTLIADGGIRYSGDIVKAIAAGADCVMAGSILAGTAESPGETSIINGRRMKTYRGMGSLASMRKGSKDRYFQDAEDEISKLVPEGIEGSVPFKGPIAEVLYQYIGGLRAGMGYCGAKDIAALKEAEIIQISNAGILESHPHDIKITKEAPNYSP